VTRTATTPGERFYAAVASVRPVDGAAADAAMRRQLELTKPPGSLGALETLGARLAAIAGRCPPPVPAPVAVVVFAGDHGVLAQGVSPWPVDVTAAMVANFARGGAAVNVLARQVGATVVVVDVGVATPIAADVGDAVVHRRVRDGTDDLSVGAAMSTDDALAALDVGVELAERCRHDGAGCLVTGDMGIGNTTPSAAVIAALTGRDAAAVTGRGTGIDDGRLARKVDAVRRGVARLPTDRALDPVGVLAEVGGLEIAALAGFVTGAAAGRVPVVIDGVIAAAGLLVAAAVAPDVVGYAVAGHRSVEPGASAVLDHLGLEPVLDLGMRLGEGTGALLAVPVVQAAARVLAEMATFGDLGLPN
jgi:nicotinate-nucleotide--dimethylbenzimidazole phosphoribosyltransferase